MGRALGPQSMPQLLAGERGEVAIAMMARGRASLSLPLDPAGAFSMALEPKPALDTLCWSEILHFCFVDSLLLFLVTLWWELGSCRVPRLCRAAICACARRRRVMPPPSLDTECTLGASEMSLICMGRSRSRKRPVLPVAWAEVACGSG